MYSVETRIQPVISGMLGVRKERKISATDFLIRKPASHTC